MEKLLNELFSEADYKPLEWHGKELFKRKNAVAEGKIVYTDWNKAKEEIQKEIEQRTFYLSKPSHQKMPKPQKIHIFIGCYDHSK